NRHSPIAKRGNGGKRRVLKGVESAHLCGRKQKRYGQQTRRMAARQRQGWRRGENYPSDRRLSPRSLVERSALEKGIKHMPRVQDTDEVRILRYFEEAPSAERKGGRSGRCSLESGHKKDL